MCFVLSDERLLRLFGAAVGEWALADPGDGDDEATNPALARLAPSQLDSDAPDRAPASAPARGAFDSAAVHAN